MANKFAQMGLKLKSIGARNIKFINSGRIRFDYDRFTLFVVEGSDGKLRLMIAGRHVGDTTYFGKRDITSLSPAGLKRYIIGLLDNSVHTYIIVAKAPDVK